MLACAALLASSTAFASPDASAAPAGPAAPAAPAAAAAVTGIVASVSSLVGQPEQELAIPVIAGLEPSRVKASIKITGRPEGSVRVSAGGRVLLEAPAAATIALDSALSAADLTANQLVLGLQYTPETRNVCSASTSSATLGGVSVDVAGTAKFPATVAEFFAPAVPAFLLPVPQDPAADVSAGILAASAAMAHRYPEAAISVVPAADFEARAAALPAGARVITVAADPGKVSTTLTNAAGRAQLALAGHDDELRTAASALASDNTALAGSAAVSGMTTSLPAAPGLTQTLKDLGAQQLKLSGYGTQEAYVGISQSQFGGTVASWTVHLRGTHTAIPAGGKAELSVYWNDYLLSSKTLDGDTLEVDAEVPSGQLQSRNGLRIRLAALPAGGDCTGPAGVMPMELTLDTSGSSFTGVRGHSLAPGFARFPQVLGQALPVAFGDGATSQANSVNAAALVVALQHDAATLLEVRKVDAKALMDSSDSGLLVGATSDTANKLSAPLRLAEFRTVTAGVLQYGVGTTAPYGALEAFEQGGRNLLMLGAWAPAGDSGSAESLQSSLAGYAQGQAGGWSALSRNLLVTQASGPPVLLESNAVIPQAAVTDDYRPYAWWVAAAVVVLGLALIGRTWLVRRRRREAQAYADAKHRAAATAASDANHGG